MNLRLASRAVRDEPVFPFSAALRAAESIGKIPESLIVVRLFDEIRTFFERNWRRASRAKLNARAGKKEGDWGEGIFARPRFPPPNFVPVKLARRPGFKFFYELIITHYSKFFKKNEFEKFTDLAANSLALLQKKAALSSWIWY